MIYVFCGNLLWVEGIAKEYNVMLRLTLLESNLMIASQWILNLFQNQKHRKKRTQGFLWMLDKSSNLRNPGKE